MGNIRTKIYSNGSTITAATDSDPPFDFSAAKSASLVIRAWNFGNTDNKVTCDVYWGVRQRGLVSVKSNVTWVKDITLTMDVSAGASTSTSVGGMLSIPVMKSPLMKVVFTPTGTNPAARVEAYIEQRT